MIINFFNSDIRDLFISIWDLTSSPVEPPAIVSNVRINQGQLFPLAVGETGNGKGHIRWFVQDANDASRTAERTIEVTSNAQIDVTTQFG